MKFLKVKCKPPKLILIYLGTRSLQTRTKLQKSIKGVFNFCKLRYFQNSKLTI